MKFSDLLTPEQKDACAYLVEDFDVMCANYLERVVTDAAKRRVHSAIDVLPLAERSRAKITVEVVTADPVLLPRIVPKFGAGG